MVCDVSGTIGPAAAAGCRECLSFALHTVQATESPIAPSSRRDRFMRFMERYAEDNALGFSKSK